MEDISKIIGDKIKEHNLNQENEENYVKFMENAVGAIVTHCNNNGMVPFFSFVACNCGCGEIHHIGNENVLPKQKVASFLEAAAKQIRETNKNVN